LAFATQLHSYGLWQKSFISYFVFLAAAHHHVLTHRHFRHFDSSAADPCNPRQETKRRKVFRMELEAQWRRRNTR
jgi:hypothetical protein